jgi:hypothetical protein
MVSQDSQGRKLLHMVSIVANLRITGIEGHYPDADGVRRPGMRGKIVGHRLLALSDSNMLITADLREDLHALEQGRGLIDKGARAIEGIRGNTRHPEGGMVGLECRQQAQGKLLLGGILRIRPRFGGPLFGRDALLLEHLGLLIPCTEFRGGLIEDKAHGEARV